MDRHDQPLSYIQEGQSRIEAGEQPDEVWRDQTERYLRKASDFEVGPEKEIPLPPEQSLPPRPRSSDLPLDRLAASFDARQEEEYARKRREREAAWSKQRDREKAEANARALKDANVFGRQREPAVKHDLAIAWASGMKPDLVAGGTLIEGTLDAGASSMVFGDSNVGKTFFALDLAGCVASGRAWNGHDITGKGAVLYLISEGGHRFANRVCALKQKLGIEDGAPFPLAIVASQIDLLDPAADRAGVIDLAAEATKTTGANVALIIIDTLSRAMAGGDENKTSDMAQIVSNVDVIRAATGAHTMVVHHSGKDAAKGARGSNVMKSSVDTEIELTRIEGAHKSVLGKFRKQRDLAGEDEFACRLTVQQLGHDNCGRPVDTASVEFFDLHAAPARPNRPKPGSASERAMSYLADVIAREGEPLPAGDDFPAHLRGAPLESWKRECAARWLSGSDEPDAQRMAFKRAFDWLAGRRLVAVRDGIVWLTRPEDEGAP